MFKRMKNLFGKNAYKNPWEKWAKVPTPGLVSRLNEITCEVMSRCDVDSTQEERDELTEKFLTCIMSEAHWITEELEHRIDRTEWAGVHDIEIVARPRRGFRMS